MKKTYKIPLAVGDTATFSKTITQAEIFQFAGISGDMNPIHVNDAYAQEIGMKACVAHGILVFSIASATEYIILMYGSKAEALKESGLTCLSSGYDRLRFLKPVFAGDTITATYEVQQVDQEKMKTISRLSVKNQKEELVFVADHILKFFPKQLNKTR